MRLSACLTVCALITIGVLWWEPSPSLPTEPSPEPATPGTAVHCEVPCGIYADQHRFEEMLEDQKTIARAIAQITELTQKDDAPSVNQVVRWVTTKDAHAVNTQSLVAGYFLAQRIKADHPDYAKQTAAAHAVTTAAMKCKQGTDPAAATKLREAILALHAAYTGKAFGTPATFTVRFETTKGNIEIKVHRKWAPIGADHFRELIKAGYYTDIAFFRVVPGFMAQFGIHGDPKTNEKWRTTIKDDPVVQSNQRGFVTYAKTGLPDSRSTQLYINYGDNSRLDEMGFAPIGQVVKGMDVVDQLNGKYGDPGGHQNPEVRRVQRGLANEGNDYLKRVMPGLDYIKKAVIITEDGKPVAK